MTGRLLRAAASPRDGAFVLDVGLLAYTQWLVLDDLEPPAAGTWLTGAISLSVDPSSYVDELAGRSDMPPLIYTWRIDEVQLSTTPQIVVEHGHPLHTRSDGRPQRVVDLGRESWRTVDRTRAWEVDGSYRLRCTLEDVPPTSTMELSGPHSPYGPLP